MCCCDHKNLSKNSTDLWYVTLKLCVATQRSVKSVGTCETVTTHNNGWLSMLAIPEVLLMAVTTKLWWYWFCHVEIFHNCYVKEDYMQTKITYNLSFLHNHSLSSAKGNITICITDYVQDQHFYDFGFQININLFINLSHKVTKYLIPPNW